MIQLRHHKAFALLALLLLLISAAACRELPTNKALDHQWAILEIQYPDGSTTIPDGKYYCFYRHTAQLTSQGDKNFTANMTQDGDRMILEFPGKSPKLMAPWGIIAPADDADISDPWIQGYTITLLNSSRLILTTDQGAVITCRKF